MQQKTYDFLVKLRVPMLTLGGELLGEAIEIVMDEMSVHSFVTLAEIESMLADRFNCTPEAADRRLRRAMDTAEFRAGKYPNPELEKLRVEYRVDTWTVKKLIYAVARSLMKT